MLALDVHLDWYVNFWSTDSEKFCAIFAFGVKGHFEVIQS